MKKGVGIRAGGSSFQRLIGVDCRMEDQQELILAGVAEESPESAPVAEQPGVPVVGIDIFLGLDVGEPVGSRPPPESPSLTLSEDGEVFMDIYDRVELLLLQDWMEHTRIM